MRQGERHSNGWTSTIDCNLARTSRQMKGNGFPVHGFGKVPTINPNKHLVRISQKKTKVETSFKEI